MGGSNGGGGEGHGVALPLRTLASATPPAPQTQKLLFKVPFSLPVAYGHEKF